MQTVEFDDVHLDESRRFNTALEELLAQVPSVHTVPPAVTREARARGTGTFPAPEVVPEGRDRSIEGRHGEIGLRTFVPPGDVSAVYLHIHGGGWVLGSSHLQDVALWRMAREAGVAVVSVDYRLAPEHPWPAGPDDCEDAARWLVDAASEEFGTDRLVIGGESAGAHLAAVTLLRLRDGAGGRPTPFAGANLVYGAYDLSMTPSQRLWGDRNLVLSTPIIQWFLDCFLPDAGPEKRRRPEYSPLYADLRGLPPALFSVGTLDPLLDDSLFMEARWRAAGNQAELRVYPESVHGFNAFPHHIAVSANSDQIEFVRSVARAI